MTTTAQIAKWADAIVTEIKADITSGQVSASVKSFSELHDYVDANDYATQVVPQGDLEWDAYLELLNDVESAVDTRIKAGEVAR